MNYDHYTVDDFLLDDQFLAYCRGSDPAAVAFWEGWQRRQPPNLSALREAERIYGLLSAQKPRLDESWRELDALIGGQPQPAKVVPMPVSRPRSFGRWAVAASVVLVSTLGLAGYWFWRNQYVVYETAFNQQRTVELPDGSTVALNSHSNLKYRRNAFSDGSRTVELAGEGHFSVRHTPTDAPFRVVTGGAFDVEVLGTEFTVLHRPAVQRVVLNAGRVAVRFHDARPTLTLQPGQLVELQPGRPPVPRPVRADQYNAWLRRQFVFENTGLPDAVRTVEDQFGITVRVAGTDLGRRTFTGVLPIDRPETVLNALAQLNGLTLRKEGDTYVLGK